MDITTIYSYLDNSSSDLHYDKSPKQASLDAVLNIFLPALSGLILPLGFTNFIILLNIGIWSSPSNFIYINLVTMDMLNAIIGILIPIDKNEDQWHKFGSYIYLISFDAEVVLLFGLALIRLLWIKMPARAIIGTLQIVAYIVSATSWLCGIVSVANFQFSKDIRNFRNFAPFDLAECGIIFITCVISIYSLTYIGRSRSVAGINSRLYRRANITSTALTLTFVAAYSYYFFLNVCMIHYELPSGKLKCPEGSWVDVFVCTDSLRIGVSFMNLQGLVNNIILLTQGQMKAFFVDKLSLCIRDIRNMRHERVSLLQHSQYINRYNIV